MRLSGVALIAVGIGLLAAGGLLVVAPCGQVTECHLGPFLSSLAIVPIALGILALAIGLRYVTKGRLRQMALDYSHQE